MDALGFAPFGYVEGSGMADVVEKFYSGYGEMADVCVPRNTTKCPGVDEYRLYHEGEAYLSTDFPKLDKIYSVTGAFSTHTHTHTHTHMHAFMYKYL